MTRDTPVVGIQGGRGSYNDSAIRRYLADNPRPGWQVRHLYTTPEVFQALEDGEISFGQFAIYNTVGGLYEESLSVLGSYRFTIVDRYTIRIAHALMIRTDASLDQVDTILTHPEVLKQCRRNLAAKYSHLEQRLGHGDLTDPSRIAEQLAAGRLPASVAVLSNPLLASIHGLHTVEEELQDDPDSESTFLLVAP